MQHVVLRVYSVTCAFRIIVSRVVARVAVTGVTASWMITITGATKTT